MAFDARSGRRALAAAAVAGVAVFAGLFTRLTEFGLYEDDYWSIAPHAGEPVRGLGSALAWDFVHWPTGRPLNSFLPQALATVGSTLGGLQGIYVLAAVGLAVNGLLVYLVARRLLSAAASLVALAAYLLYPADTTRILLVHAGHVQGSMTFLLVAVLLWFAGGWRRALSYPVAALTLLAYETAFLPFVALPLLVPFPRGKRAVGWAVHLGGCAAAVGADTVARVITGDVRALAAAHDHWESLRRMVTSLYLGPRTSGAALWSGPVEGVRHVDPLAVASAAILAAVFALAVLSVAAAPGPSPQHPAGADAGAAGATPPGRPWPWVLAASIAIWSFSYVLTLINYPPTQVAGRLTSTHVAAAFPASLAVAALFEALYRAGTWRGRALLAAVTGWLAALVLHGHVVQRGYVRALDRQRRFWSQALDLTPDVGAGWTILVGGTPTVVTPIIFSNAWDDLYVYRQLTPFGAFDAGAPAFGHLGVLGDQVHFERRGGAVYWRPQFWSADPLSEIDPAKLALLLDEGGVLRRVTELPVGGEVLRATASIPAVTAPARPLADTFVARVLFPDRFPIP